MKSKKKKTLANINMLLYRKTDVIKFIEDYISMILEAKHKAKYGEGLKISTLKQMLQD